jgi:hypothetical protein
MCAPSGGSCGTLVTFPIMPYYNLNVLFVQLDVMPHYALYHALHCAS